MTEPNPPVSPPSLPNPSPSPPWGALPKLMAALVVVVVAGLLISHFRNMIAPLMFALIFAYLVNPPLRWVVSKTRLPWGLVVNLLYLALFVLLVAGLTAAAIGIVQQSQGLYRTIVDILPDLPTRLQALLQAFLAQPIHIGTFTVDLSKPVVIGPFMLDLSASNLTPLLQQIVAAIQPLLSQAGVAMGSLASVTAAMFGWMLFLLVISYYVLHDLHDITPTLSRAMPEAYGYDVRRLTAELGPIWNAFFRGQITLAIVVGLIVGLAMLILGVVYAPVLGLLAAAMEFIPIVGPLISALTGVLIALFQPWNEFGLNQVYFALLVAGVYFVIQQLDSNFLGPRIVGGRLNLHPAVIIIGAVIAADLAGVVGLILTAPTLATLRLFGNYIYRKLFDLDPWPPAPPLPPAPPPSANSKMPQWLRQTAARLSRLLTGK
jgi:predicted PurR-regulated permease PerM